MKLILAIALACICSTLLTNAQTVDFRGAENIYDMMAIYGQTGNVDLPDSTKGAINKEIERTLKIWAPRLYPTGEFTVVQSALQEVAERSLLKTAACSNNYENEEREEMGFPIWCLLVNQKYY